MGYRIGDIMNFIKKYKYIITLIISVLISFILIAALFNLVNKWTKMYQCDHIPFIEALKDEQCREYFGMKVIEYDKRK